MVSVLIVEDEKNLAVTLERALLHASNGEFNIVVCHSGGEAASILARQSFNLVMSDLRLPDISGLALLARIRQLNPSVKTILITAFGTEQVETQARHYTDAYLTKPFNLPDMIHLVKQIVQEATADENSQAVLVEDVYEGTAACLEHMRREINAPYAMLIDNNSNVMVDSGTPGQIDNAIMNALLCNSMAAASEVANAFNEPKSFDLHYYDGENYEIYCRKINDDMFLALVVDLHRTQARMGTVWHVLKQTVQDIREQHEELSRMGDRSLEMMHDSFGENVSDALGDALFGFE